MRVLRGTTEQWSKSAIIPANGQLCMSYVGTESEGFSSVILKVGDGIHTFDELPLPESSSSTFKIYYGADAPSSDFGENGDLYIQYGDLVV